LYDEGGRLAGVVDPAGERVVYEYDALGRIVRMTTP